MLGLGPVHSVDAAEEPRVHLARQSYALDISRQTLTAALQQFAKQTGLQVARLSGEGEGEPQVGPLVGAFSASDALERLLRGSRFTYRVVDDRTIAIVAVPPAADARLRDRAEKRTTTRDIGGSTEREAPQPEGPPAQRASTAPPAAPVVVVTGSRIQQSTSTSSPTPVTVMMKRDLDDLSAGSLIDAMSLMPQFLMNSTPTNAFSFATNAGQSFLNLRGLGPNRTLVLLDGRRVVSSSRLGSTDIGIFPTALVQRVEVITGGASAAYGSDAVGGVANFVLDRKFSGLRAEAHGGMTDRGDQGRYSVSLAGGTQAGDGLHLLGSIEYEHANGIDSYAGRNWFQGWGRVTNPQWVRTGNGPEVLTLPHVTSTRYTFGGLINQPGSALNRLAFDPDGTARPFVLGPIAAVGYGTYSQSGGGGDNYEADRSGDGSLLPGVERGSAFGSLEYTLSDDAYIYAQVLGGHNHIDFAHVGAVQFGQWQATIFRDNAYLPEDLRAVMEREGLQQFGFSRMASSADLGRARDLIDNHTYSLTTGFKASRASWHLGGYYQYGRNDGDSTLRDYVRTDRLSIALDAVRDPGTGAIVCRSTLFNRANGCVPIDLFGAGRASPDAIDYVLDDKLGHVTVQQHFAEISADGPLSSGLSAGPVLFALGASFREDSFTQGATPSDAVVSTPANDPSQGIRGIPTAFVGSFVHQLSSFPDLRGAYTVKEGFAEARVPLYSSEDKARRAGASLAARYALYSGSGGVWAWKAGVDTDVSADLRLRGTVSRDTRAANLSERFDLQNRGFTARDPMFGNSVYTLSATSAGNQAVEPEKADTITLGAVYQPVALGGLSLSLDWYSISVRDAIGQLGPQAIIDNCFAGTTRLCDFITRDADTHEIVFVRNTFLNVAEAKASGVDLELNWSGTVRLFDAPDNFEARLLASWLNENSTTFEHGQKVDRAGQTGGSASGSAAFPDLQLIALLRYRHGPFGLYLQGHYIDRGSLDAMLRQGIDIDDNTVSSVFYTDLSLSYASRWRKGGSWQLYAQVENLFDRDPPRAPDYSDFNGATPTNESLFDVVGRRYTLGMRVKF